MHSLIHRVGERERAHIEEVLASEFSNSRNTGMIGRFERAFAEKFGTKYAVAHTNGTATLHSALYAAGVRAGDEVITTPLTMSATTMAILQADALPVFADVVEGTYQIDPRSVEKLITPRTKVIMPVALYGLSPDLDALMEIAEKHGLKIIEDDAQCFLGSYKGRTVGTIGHLSSFSLQSTKHMTAGEGGVVCTDDAELADEIRRFSVLGYGSVSHAKATITKDDIQNPDYERHVQMGFNYRISELNAAVALGQLEHLDELVQRRIDVAHLFLDTLEGCEWLVPQAEPEGYRHAYWSFAPRLVHPRVTWVQFRGKFMELGGDGIYAAWKPTYLEPFFLNRNFSGKERVIETFHPEPSQEWKPGICPVAEKLQKKILAFKTNYWDFSRAEEQAVILKQTIRAFGQA